jgi:AcrR family transcriptional regulator
VGRREQNKASKQERLEAAGLAAFLADGYVGASVERIAAAAEVARGTFYLYFKDKEALFVALLDRFFLPLLEAVTEARDALSRCEDAASTYPIYGALGERVVSVVVGHPQAVQLYFHEARARGAGGAVVRTRATLLEALVREILADSVAHGILRAHDTHVAALTISGGIERLTWAFLQGDAELALERITGEVTALLSFGLAPR